VMSMSVSIDPNLGSSDRSFKNSPTMPHMVWLLHSRLGDASSKTSAAQLARNNF
jgi:hypothetical protein